VAEIALAPGVTLSTCVWQCTQRSELIFVYVVTTP
jgi:hypothetical protein